jgi:hypothetical protein
LTRVGSDVVETAEDLEGWVSFNTIRLAKLLLLCAVDFDQPDVLLF